jgi:S1-C subfamily serine protease
MYRLPQSQTATVADCHSRGTGLLRPCTHLRRTAACPPREGGGRTVRARYAYQSRAYITCRVRGTTGGAKGLPSVILGVRPDGAAAAASVAVGERLLAINGAPVTDHEAASQLLRASTGEVVQPHGHSTHSTLLALWPELGSCASPGRARRLGAA